MVTTRRPMDGEAGTPFEPAPPGRSPLYRAWISIALVPVFFLGAFAVAYGIYAVTGHDPSTGATPPRWVDVAAGLGALAVLLVPCVAGVLFGRQAARAGAPAGRVPEVLAALLALGSVALVVLGTA